MEKKLLVISGKTASALWKQLLVISGKNGLWFLEKNYWWFLEKLLVLYGKAASALWKELLVLYEKNRWWFLYTSFTLLGNVRYFCQNYPGLHSENLPLFNVGNFGFIPNNISHGMHVNFIVFFGGWKMPLLFWLVEFQSGTTNWEFGGLSHH